MVEIQFDFGFGQILDRLVVVEVVNLVNSSEVKGLSLLDVIFELFYLFLIFNELLKLSIVIKSIQIRLFRDQLIKVRSRSVV